MDRALIERAIASAKARIYKLTDDEKKNPSVGHQKKIERQKEVMEVTVEALERMLPKKVIVQINDKDARIGHVVFAKGTKAYICQCGNRVIRSWKHCAECGQKIDWSE